MLIDAHAHIFPKVNGRIGRGKTRSIGFGRMQVGDDHIAHVLPPVAIKTTYPPEVLIQYMNWAGVEKTVLLQGTFYGECNRYTAEAIRRWPDRLLGQAFLDPWESGARQMFDEAVGELGFRGIKLELSEAAGLSGLHPDLRLDGSNVDWLWKEMANRDLLLTLDLGAIGSRSYQTDAVRQIIEQHPDLRIVIAHLCQPNPVAEQDEALWALWHEQVALACNPNVYMDTAALPAYLQDEGYPFPSARRYIQNAVNVTGPDKILWGTDIPGLLTVATYRQLVRAAYEHTDFLSTGDQAKVLGGNAMKIYGAS
ncbi:MAG: amidohydrolase family protein [Gemmatimonadota bacterium]|nr:amidohydrolase family protein [Gemmatimonadota bacterium]